MGRVRTVQGGDGDRQIFSEGRKGPGGAYHQYAVGLIGNVPGIVAQIKFQKGCARKKGWNGCTNEDLLNVVRDRLECFQAGPFPCKENDRALVHVQRALKALNKRTADRKKRNVEGLNKA
jgi:hypothetical protein